MSDPITDILAEADALNGRDPETMRQLRLIEAILFAATEPVSAEDLAVRLPDGAKTEDLLLELRGYYAPRGVNLQHVGGKWAFRTAPDLAPMLRGEAPVTKRLSRAAVETLAIVAYHQPVTRAEIEDIRGVAVSKGTIDILLEAEWVRPMGRRRSPGRPLTWGITDTFLDHFGLATRDDLPGLDDLRHSGLLDGAAFLADSASESRDLFGEDERDDGFDAEDWSDDDYADAIEETPDDPPDEVEAA